LGDNFKRHFPVLAIASLNLNIMKISIVAILVITPLICFGQSTGFKFPEDKSVKEILRMEGVENAYPRWGTNGKIIFQSNRDGRWQIYTMNADGSEQVNLSKNNFNDNFVSTSADGKYIGFVSDRDGNEEIYVMTSDGKNQVRMTNHPSRDIHPYFSADGKTILFNSMRDGESNFEVYSIKIDGSGLTRLTSTTDNETCARLSPDGTKILYLAGLVAEGNDEVFVMDNKGKNLKNLTVSPQGEGWPVWSSDGAKVYYATMSGGTFCIFEMAADGSAKKQLTTVKSPFMDARPEISPDGKEMVFNRQVTERDGRNTIAIYMRSL
jgi:TolB protein